VFRKAEAIRADIRSSFMGFSGDDKVEKAN